MGDAILAGLGTGEIKDHRVIEKWIGEKHPTEPKPENMAKYQRIYKIYVEAINRLTTIYLTFEL